MAQTKNGKQALNLADKEKAVAFSIVPAGAGSTRDARLTTPASLWSTSAIP